MVWCALDLKQQKARKTMFKITYIIETGNALGAYSPATAVYEAIRDSLDKVQGECILSLRGTETLPIKIYDDNGNHIGVAIVEGKD